ncbi:acylneuraminate cytidylyltransferase family protein [bacterium]|nr:acylneuraminate cytidylyltransferase family protein [bacterium]
MKRLCIIPARGGSKRLPGKNIKPLNGKPLVFYTIDSVLNSEMFNKVIFTSDDDKILETVSNNYLSTVLEVIKRPLELATDTSKVIDTVLHFVDKDYDQTWLTLPTSPLKTSIDFIKASELLTEQDDAVLSYTEMEFPPTLGLVVKHNNILEDYDQTNPWQNGNSRSQDHPMVYRPNGAIYGSWTNKLKENKNYYIGQTKGYFMPRNRSIDIDTQFDFDLAEFMLNQH